ncbi:MAG: hypothetical protein R3C56_06010 [Pirellulaceae bacterium]
MPIFPRNPRNGSNDPHRRRKSLTAPPVGRSNIQSLNINNYLVTDRYAFFLAAFFFAVVFFAVPFTAVFLLSDLAATFTLAPFFFVPLATIDTTVVAVLPLLADFLSLLDASAEPLAETFPEPLTAVLLVALAAGAALRFLPPKAVFQPDA